MKEPLSRMRTSEAVTWMFSYQGEVLEHDGAIVQYDDL
jgi:hypothetical protein